MSETGEQERKKLWYPSLSMEREEFIRISREMFGGSGDVLAQQHLRDILSGKFFSRSGWDTREEAKSNPLPLSQAALPRVYVPSSGLVSLAGELYRRLLNEMRKAGGRIAPMVQERNLSNHPVRHYSLTEHVLFLQNRSDAALQVTLDMNRRVEAVSHTENAGEHSRFLFVYTNSRTDMNIQEEKITGVETRRYNGGPEAKFFLRYSSGTLDNEIVLSVDTVSMVYTKVRWRNEYHLTSPYPKLRLIRPIRVIKTDEEHLIYTVNHSGGEEPVYRNIPSHIDEGQLLKRIFSGFLKEKPI